VFEFPAGLFFDRRPPDGVCRHSCANLEFIKGVTIAMSVIGASMIGIMVGCCSLCRKPLFRPHAPFGQVPTESRTAMCEPLRAPELTNAGNPEQLW
jgi:hypothetical protein